MIAAWPSPCGEEYALVFDRRRAHRVLVLPGWFDEGNKLRHFTVEVMRRLDRAGIDSFLPDLPGCNESLVPLEKQTLDGWRVAAAQAAQHFCANLVLTIRASALIAPNSLPGWRYAPVAGNTQLRSLLRSRVLASREAGREENREGLLAEGRQNGLQLAGHRLGPKMISELAEAELPEAGKLHEVTQSDIGGAALWLRAEPDHDPTQADALAATVAAGLTA